MLRAPGDAGRVERPAVRRNCKVTHAALMPYQPSPLLASRKVPKQDGTIARAGGGYSAIGRNGDSGNPTPMPVPLHQFVSGSEIADACGQAVCGRKRLAVWRECDGLRE